jgi:integral membrane protein (TIGR01906 family)
MSSLEQKIPKTRATKIAISTSMLLITLAIPILLVLLSVRLVMTPLFLQLEYHRPGFPDDFYGFTLEDRLHYAPYAIDYLLNGEDISYLGNLTFSTGAPLYTEHELSHMADVKLVTRAAFFLLLIGGIAAGIIGFVLWRNRATRPDFWQAMFSGGLLTLGCIVVIVLGAVFAWDYFFTTFHELFFKEGTWMFLYSDTLIRLFPEQFWFDISLTLGVFTVGGALALTGLAWRQMRHSA